MRCREIQGKTGVYIYMVSVYGLGLRVWGLGFSFYEPTGEGKAIRAS